MILDKMMRRTDGDIAFKKLAKEYRKNQKDLQTVKDYSVELQKKNRELMVENERLKKKMTTSI